LINNAGTKNKSFSGKLKLCYAPDVFERNSGTKLKKGENIFTKPILYDKCV
jgi:hypothetical protein